MTNGAETSRDLDREVAGNLAIVRERIAAAAARGGRRASDVRLVAVSKTFGIDHVRAAVAAGQSEFGENRVQEAAGKIAAASTPGVTWHLIGHLQSNKTRKAAEIFGWIQSVDSVALLQRIDAAVGDGPPITVLVQVDLAAEPTKHGAPPEEARRIFEAAHGCGGVRPAGLMLLPPFFDDPEQARPYFRQLRDLQETLRRDRIPEEWLRELSMGMSHDLEVAVEEGATIVRVGTAIFGRRPKPA